MQIFFTFLTLFRKIDFYLVLDDKSSPYNIFTIMCEVPIIVHYI